MTLFTVTPLMAAPMILRVFGHVFDISVNVRFLYIHVSGK
jgi:hypothetical protein